MGSDKFKKMMRENAAKAMAEVSLKDLPIYSDKKHIGEQELGHMNEQVSEQLDRYIDKQINNKTTGKVFTQLLSQTTEQIPRQEGEQELGHMDEQVNEQLDKQQLTQKNDHEKTEAHSTTKNISTKNLYTETGISFEVRCRGFSEATKVFLWHLIKSPMRRVTIMGLKLFSNGKIIPYSTLRNAWNRLIREGFIISRLTCGTGTYKYIEYELDENKLRIFKKVVPYEALGKVSEQVNRQMNEQVSEQLDKQQLGQEDGQEVEQLHSSSRSFKNTTTTIDEIHNQEELQKILLTDADLSFWKEQKLSDRQISMWSKEFNIPIELLLEYLRYAGFELTNKQDVKNPLNWFYVILKKSGSYPKPTGYINYIDKQNEKLQELLEEKKKKLKKNEELLKQSAAIEAIEAFEYFFENEKDSDLYKEIMKCIPQFIQRGSNKNLLKQTALTQYKRLLKLE